MVQVVQFNISGRRYEVSRSLLDKHPKSRPASKASEQYSSSKDQNLKPSSSAIDSIFNLPLTTHVVYDRCLLVLPLPESKELILVELECYGFEVDVNNLKHN